MYFPCFFCVVSPGIYASHGKSRTLNTIIKKMNDFAFFVFEFCNRYKEQTIRGTSRILLPWWGACLTWWRACLILYISFLFLFVFSQPGIHARNEPVAGHLVPYSHDEGYAWFHPASAFRLLGNWGLCTHILICVYMYWTYIYRVTTTDVLFSYVIFRQRALWLVLICAYLLYTYILLGQDTEDFLFW